MSNPQTTARWTGPYEVTGPYHYAHDVHPSFTIRGRDKIIASVFAPDGNEDAAYRRALVMAHALTECC